MGPSQDFPESLKSSIIKSEDIALPLQVMDVIAQSQLQLLSPPYSNLLKLTLLMGNNMEIRYYYIYQDP